MIKLSMGIQFRLRAGARRDFFSFRKQERNNKDSEIKIAVVAKNTGSVFEVNPNCMSNGSADIFSALRR